MRSAFVSWAETLLRPLDCGRRWLGTAALVAAGLAHLPVIGAHLEEAP